MFFFHARNFPFSTPCQSISLVKVIFQNKPAKSALSDGYDDHCMLSSENGLRCSTYVSTLKIDKMQFFDYS